MACIGLRRRQLLTVGLGALPLGARAAVRVPSGSGEEDLRYEFPLALLELLLRASGLPHDFARERGLNESDIQAGLLDGRLDLSILPSVGVRAPGLLALRQPIRRGLLGVRLLLARRERLAELSQLHSLDALKRRYRLGYGAAWLDAAQMETLGFRLRRYAQYPELFRALARGEIDFLHRGVNEVWGELDHPLLVPHGIAVVPRVALSYPLDDYFHLGPARHNWLPLLQEGWRQLWRTGAYQRLFFDTFGRALERAAFAQRRVLPLVGYGIEPGTPLREFDALRLQPTQALLNPP